LTVLEALRTRFKDNPKSRYRQSPETQQQCDYIISFTDTLRKIEQRQKALLADRTRACFIGGAIGDALGASIEFMTVSEIRRRYGPHGITGYVREFPLHRQHYVQRRHKDRALSRGRRFRHRQSPAENRAGRNRRRQSGCRRYATCRSYQTHAFRHSLPFRPGYVPQRKRAYPQTIFLVPRQGNSYASAVQADRPEFIVEKSGTSLGVIFF
jgi:hypothetical protein